ncbi:glycosyltransferase [Thiohalobacter sp. IOR34]|uniref:glycosyltransferase family protein n=1 Tax=Thiohalobacter sp. IOR34 TaxID=3057176 RepID=UPI0025B1CDB4|nr:glycosyltransferase [Thiohalobacter sp. IOR34]WJW75119.1 glycosyltransferase [Thiohalobacter sp. IOR34]
MIRILHVGDLGLKRYGQLPNTFERKMVYGLLRNDYCVYEFSDKDVAKFEAPLGISRLGIAAVNRRLLETVDNFRPDLVIFSNSRKIPNATLETLRRRWPATRIACYTCDPLFSEDNRAHQVQRLSVCDRLFVTMAGPMLHELARQGAAPVHYLPNPADPSVECLDNSAREDLDIDLLFCGTGGNELPRTRLMQQLQSSLPPALRFEVYGILGRPKITGYDYFSVLARTRMAININKQEQPLYSSDRLAQLMGNGILALLHQDSGLQCFFGEERAVFFSGHDDLRDRVVELAADDERRRTIARAGRDYYMMHFSARQVARFVVETTLETGLGEDYVWPVERF